MKLRLKEIPPRTVFYLFLVLSLSYQAFNLWCVADARWFPPLAATFAYIFTVYVSVDLAELIIYGHLLD